MYYNSNIKNINLEISYLKDGCQYVLGVNVDANPLITSENNEAWARYLRDKLSSLVTEDAMQSPEFQKIEADIAERIRHEKEWAAGAAERERKERHRKKLGRTQSLGFIPLGLTVDYSVEYGAYVDKAIAWTPEDADDFLFQLRSLERMAVKCSARCVENHRPDAAYVQAHEVCRKVPKWKSRKELQVYFDQYKPRLRKFLNAIFKGLIDSAIAWNHIEKLKEANDLIASQADEYGLIADRLNKAGKAGKLSATDISYFHKAWTEIQAMEACQSYGIADYKFDM